VPEGDQIIPVINRLIDQFDVIIQTQDWHTKNHSSFASAHPEKNQYDIVEMKYGTQVLWPDHCVQGTDGAAFHPDLNTDKTQVIIRKGFRKSIDSYSTFFENDQTTKTGLTGYLNDRGIKEFYAVGLATDFCVKWSVLDGMKEGFKVNVIEDAVRGIDMNGSLNQAWKEMKSAGASIVQSKELLD